MKSRSSCSLPFNKKTVRFSCEKGPATSKTPSSSCSRFSFTGSLRWQPPREMRARSTALHSPKVAALFMTHLQRERFGDQARSPDSTLATVGDAHKSDQRIVTWQLQSSRSQAPPGNALLARLCLADVGRDFERDGRRSLPGR